MRRLGAFGRAAAALAAVAGLALGLGMPAAGAAQTSTWGIAAAPDGGNRSSLSHPANGATVHDAVLVWNRTASPLTVDLNVLGTSYQGGAYQFSGPTSGLAGHVSLGAHKLVLAPHQEVRVAVTIREPRRVPGTELAGIAGEAAPLQDGALSIQERLVVLVKATPTSAILPVAVKDVTVWGTIAAILLAAVIAVTVLVRRRAPRLGAA